jgi:hypothetical protein
MEFREAGPRVQDPRRDATASPTTRTVRRPPGFERRAVAEPGLELADRLVEEPCDEVEEFPIDAFDIS